MRHYGKGKQGRKRVSELVGMAKPTDGRGLRMAFRVVWTPEYRGKWGTGQNSEVGGFAVLEMADTLRTD